MMSRSPSELSSYPNSSLSCVFAPAGVTTAPFVVAALLRANPQALDATLEPGYDLPMKLSARNHLVGKVEELKLGDILAHAVVRVGDNLIDSVITRRSAEEMDLKVGDTVAAVIKSTEVMLQKE